MARKCTRAASPVTFIAALAWLLCFVVGPAAAARADTSPAQPGDPAKGMTDAAPESCVILLHGLGRTAASMRKLEGRLRRHGYYAYNPGYPSRAADIGDLARAHVAPAVEHCSARGARHIHFVTHSMGGILLRHYLQDATPAGLGRVVMLAPPNGGSPIIDSLGNWGVFRAVMGPAALQLGTGAHGAPSRLGPVPGEIGVIAGNRSAEPWFSRLIPGEDDGKVSVQSTRLAEMRDFMVVPFGHTFIMRKERVIEQVLAFLAEGQFRRELP